MTQHDEKSIGEPINREQLKAAFEQELVQNSMTIEQPRPFADITINYGAFGPHADVVKSTSDRFKTWLKQPYVMDQYGASGEGHDVGRVKLREKLEAQYGAELPTEVYSLFHGSKLSGNNRQTTFTAWYRLIQSLKTDSAFASLAEQAQALYDKIPEFNNNEGENLDLETLRKRTEEVEDLVYEVLEVLSKFSQQ